MKQDFIQKILKDSNFHLSLFTENEINYLRNEIFTKTVRGKEAPFINCIIRKKDIQLKPEEIVRQLYAKRLIKQYNYPERRIAFEHPVTFGREKKSADIVIFDKDRSDTAYIIIELKKPKLKDGKNQLRSYCNATGAPIGVWTNGEKISHYHRKDPNFFEDITDIPKANQSLKDILSERFTLKGLIIKDKISNGRKSLKDIILEMEDEVLANAGVDVFEEVFKLIFTKLYDEFCSKKDKANIEFFLEQNLDDEERADYDTLKICLEKLNDKKFRIMEFRNTGQTDTELKNKIQELFDKAKEQWTGVFPEGSFFDLSDSHLSVCVSSLQDIKLFNSNLLVVDEAFEYLVNKSAKGEKGQYFTPRHVIDMCVQMLNPKRGEYMIDTASGRKKEIYESLYPGTKQGSKGGWHNNKTQKLEKADSALSRSSFVSDTADQTKKSYTVIKEEIRISKNLAPEVKQRIRDTELANRKTDLLNLAREKPEKQTAIVEKLVVPGIKDIAAAKRAVKKDEYLERCELAEKQRTDPAENDKLPDLILADPPWEYDDSTPSRRVENHYQTLSVREIAKHLPETKPDCILLLWATAPMLIEAIELIDLWGFEYKTGAVWDKGKPGMGYWLRGQHELLLIALKGKVSPPLPEFRVSSVFREERTEHSRKPECVYHWIEQAFGDKVKLEMYARQTREGWHTWGNEVT